MIFGLECNNNKKCNIHIFKKIKKISYYNQISCVFCCNDFKDFNQDIITLPCKHVFDLRCFINYTKMNYLQNKNKDIECPICKCSNEILDIFKKYKVILEIRLLMSTKQKLVKNIFVYDDIYKKNKRTRNIQNNQYAEIKIKNESVETIKNESL